MFCACLMFPRFSPYEWEPPNSCNPQEDEVTTQFTFRNALWFSIGSLMQQGWFQWPICLRRNISF